MNKKTESDPSQLADDLRALAACISNPVTSNAKYLANSILADVVSLRDQFYEVSRNGDTITGANAKYASDEQERLDERLRTASEAMALISKGTAIDPAGIKCVADGIDAATGRSGQPERLSRDEAAKRANVSARTINRAVANRKLAKQPDGTFRMGDVDQYIKMHAKPQKKRTLTPQQIDKRIKSAKLEKMRRGFD